MTVSPTGIPSNFSQEVGSLEKEFQNTLSDLKWAEQRIRVLEVYYNLINFKFFSVKIQKKY